MKRYETFFSFEKKLKKGDVRDDTKLIQKIGDTILKHRKLTAGQMIDPEAFKNAPLDKQCGWYLETAGEPAAEKVMEEPGYYLFGIKQSLPPNLFYVTVLKIYFEIKFFSILAYVTESGRQI